MVDNSFDVAIVMSFSDVAAMRSYLEHPLHKKSVQETLAPLVGKMIVYDVVDVLQKSE